jgi:hypothetical protein
VNGGYAAPEPPAFDRAGVLVIRSLAECAACEARSGWWIGAVSTSWTTAHVRDAHPQQASVRFRLWRIIRHDSVVTDDGLTHTPQAAPNPGPVDFELSECLVCGVASGWLTAQEAGSDHGLQEFELHHRRINAHPQQPPVFDRWRLTGHVQGPGHTPRLHRPSTSI